MQSVKYIIDLETYNHEQINSKTLPLPDGRKYTILNYRNGESIDETSEKYRSVVVNETGNIVCFAPPKSILFETFKNKYSVEEESIIINEVIEGTMINLFYDKESSLWEIATKASVGGNYWYFRNQYPILSETMNKPEMTFRKMFLQAFGMNESDDLQNNVILETLDKKYCYSFILQHPMNHIVHSIIAPTIYLVAVYEIVETNVSVIDPNEYEIWPNIMNSPIRFPTRIKMSYEDIIYQKCSPDSTYDIPGVMFLNRETGERACMENEAYKKVREIRGNHPNLQFQYLSLRKTNKVGEFLIYFNQYAELFGKFEMQYNDFIKQLHNEMYNLKKLIKK
jgi:hypothetical protein